MCLLFLIWLAATVHAATPPPPAAWTAYRELIDPGWPARGEAGIQAALQRACTGGYAPACADGRLVQRGSWDLPALALAASARCTKKDPLSCAVGDAAGLLRGESKAPLLSGACTLGSDAACAILADFRRRGIGIPRDPKRARSDLEATCTGSSSPARACRVLGQMRAFGDGGPRDREGAEGPLAWACAKADAPACAELGWLRVEFKDPVGADERLAQACEGGITGACTVGTGAALQATAHCGAAGLLACPVAPFPDWDPKEKVDGAGYEDQLRLKNAVRAALPLRPVLDRCLDTRAPAFAWPHGIIDLRYSWKPDGARGPVEVVDDASGVPGLADCVAAGVIPYPGITGSPDDLTVWVSVGAYSFQARNASGDYPRFSPD